MDTAPFLWYLSDMGREPIPNWQLYGEQNVFPDVLHVERIVDRAAGLDWTIAPHRHLHLHQIFLLMSGSVRMTIDGRSRDSAPPVILSIPPGAVHAFVFSAGTDGYVLTMPVSNFPMLFGASAETAAALGQTFTLEGRHIQTRIAEISALHAGNQPYRQTLLRAEATVLVTTLLAMAPKARQGRTADPRIARFETLIRQSLADSRDIGSYAADLALSPRHLSRLCKSETGLSARDFVETLKMHEACRLLVYTRMTAQQIAYGLGFDDPSYFSRAFKRHLALSPASYRAQFEARV